MIGKAIAFSSCYDIRKILNSSEINSVDDELAGNTETLFHTPLFRQGIKAFPDLIFLEGLAGVDAALNGNKNVGM
jgi:hypothetical protein